MTLKRFVAVGECMIEMSGGTDGHWKMGIAGDTLNTAWHFRNATNDFYLLAREFCGAKDG
mgnify:CR=1 FL=1